MAFTVTLPFPVRRTSPAGTVYIKNPLKNVASFRLICILEDKRRKAQKFLNGTSKFQKQLQCSRFSWNLNLMFDSGNLVALEYINDVEHITEYPGYFY